MTFLPVLSVLRKQSKRLAVALPALLLCGVAAMFSYGMLRAALVLYTYPERPAPLAVRVYYRVFGSTIERKDFSFDGRAGPIALRVYTPVGCKAPVPIVLVHGFSPMGNGDIHLNVFGRALTRAGFAVLVPTLPAETRYEMKLSDVLVIEDTIRWAAEAYGRKPAVFGISFGGGLIVPAVAAQQEHVRATFVLSGYDDLDRVGKYYIHERVTDPEGRTYSDRGPNIGRIVIAAYLTEMLEPADAKVLAKPIEKIRLHPERPLPATDASLQGLSERERALFEDMQVIQTPEMRRRFLRILSRHHLEFAAISPSSVLPGMRVPLFVLHGWNDEIFPPGEALWMKEQSSANPAVHVLITRSMTHVAVGQSPATLERLQVGFFFARLLFRISR